MEDKTIPYYAFERAQANHERTVKKLVIAIITSIILLFSSNAIWLYAWLQYDYSATTSSEIHAYNQNGEGLNIIGNNNGVPNGSDINNQENHDNKKTKKEK